MLKKDLYLLNRDHYTGRKKCNRNLLGDHFIAYHPTNPANRRLDMASGRHTTDNIKADCTISVADLNRVHCPSHDLSGSSGRPKYATPY